MAGSDTGETGEAGGDWRRKLGSTGEIRGNISIRKLKPPPGESSDFNHFYLHNLKCSVTNVEPSEIIIKNKVGE